MKISIITSLFKSNEYIKRYTKYLLKTVNYFVIKHIDFEVIIISNSTSESERNSLKKLNDQILDIKVVEVERETIYASWNRGINMATGDIITFWNADDIRFGKALIAGRRLIKNGADIVYFTFVTIKKHKYYKYIPIYKIKIIKPPKYSSSRNDEGMIGGPFFMFNKEILLKVGYFDEQYKVVGDYDWFIRAGRSGINFVRSFLPAGLYIKQGGALSGGSNNDIHKVENQVLYRKYNLINKIEELSSNEIEIFKKYKV